jgi:hypothetical protein
MLQTPGKPTFPRVPLSLLRDMGSRLTVLQLPTWEGAIRHSCGDWLRHQGKLARNLSSGHMMLTPPFHLSDKDLKSGPFPTSEMPSVSSL